MLSGCAFTKPWRFDKSSYREHTVKYPGETLGIISAWYTGSPGNWQNLRTENGTPDVIRIGDKVYVPKAIAKKSRPLPREFVSAHYHPARARYARDERSSAEDSAAATAEGLVCMSNDELAAYCRGVSDSSRYEERERKESDLLRQLIRPF